MADDEDLKYKTRIIVKDGDDITDIMEMEESYSPYTIVGFIAASLQRPLAFNASSITVEITSNSEAPMLINKVFDTERDEIVPKGEMERLRAGIFHIMAAARDGKVCDDVAWFDEFQTLWDHCSWLVNWDKDPSLPLPTDGPTEADHKYVEQMSEKGDINDD